MKYNPDKHHRCASNYSVAYTFLKDNKVVLCVHQYGIESLVPRTDGDGKVFPSIDIAREFAFTKGYIVEYDPEEESERLMKLQVKRSQKVLNKRTQPAV